MLVLAVRLPACVLDNYITYHVLDDDLFLEENWFRLIQPSMWISLVLDPIYVGALIYALAKLQLAQPVRFAEALLVGLKKWGPLLLAQIVAALLIGFGLLALVVPGLILFVQYTFLNEVVVLEDGRVFNARKRSSLITLGIRWRIVGVALAFLVPFAGLAWLVTLPLENLLHPYDMVVSILGDCVLDVAFAVLQIVLFLYYWEATAKERGEVAPAIETAPSGFWTWLIHSRWRTPIALAGIAVVVSLFYAEENWRGKRDWDQYKRDCREEGGKITRDDVIPSPVPDEQNFASIPLLKPWFEYTRTAQGDLRRSNSNAVVQLSRINPFGENGIRKNPPGFGQWETCESINLRAWQRFYRANTNFPQTPLPQSPSQDVLLALSRFKVPLETISFESKRPRSNFAIHYEEGDDALLPHLNSLRSWARLYTLRARAKLELQDVNEAFDDVMTCFRLAGSLESEPVLLSKLVRISILRVGLQVLWEGSADHQWSYVQLDAFQQQLSLFDWQEDLCSAYEGEQAMSNSTVEKLIANGDLDGLITFVASQKSSDPARIAEFIKLAPLGWLYQNLKSANELYRSHVLESADPSHSTFRPLPRRPKQTWSPFNRLADELTFWVNATPKFALAKGLTDLAVVACGLEKYRLLNGEYPDDIELLVPQFVTEMPKDAISGKPLKYCRPSPQQFILYEIGMNGRDDNGVVAFKAGNAADWDFQKGDWVWQYPNNP